MRDVAVEVVAEEGMVAVAPAHVAPADSGDANFMEVRATRSPSSAKPPPKLLCRLKGEGLMDG
jgi:hypothetical protein